MKTCVKCEIEKNREAFSQSRNAKDGLQSYCKICSENYQVSRKEERAIYQKKYRLLNKDKSAKYRIDRREKTAKYRKQYDSERRETDLLFKLTANLRTRLCNAIKNDQKKGSAIKDLGCSIPEFKKYLESKFQEGMSWANWSHDGWHIDHIYPLSKFELNDREQFLKANHYTNLQPMWAEDNLKKANKIVS